MATKRYPLPSPVKSSGTPYTGSHGASAPNNWESRNAVDLDTAVGTPVYATAAGVIGPQIGSLHSTDPKMQGLRLHLVTGDNEFYFAHLSKIVVKAGQHVADGQLLGYTGKANGVAHLHFASKNGDPEQILAAQTTNTGPADTGTAATTGAAVASAVPGAGASPPPNRFTTPPPVESGLAQPQALDPGTVPADAANPHQYQETWQRIAADPWAPPETQNYVSLWQGGQ